MGRVLTLTLLVGASSCVVTHRNFWCACHFFSHPSSGPRSSPTYKAQKGFGGSLEAARHVAAPSRSLCSRMFGGQSWIYAVAVPSFHKGFA